MKKVSSNWSCELWAECPYCGEYQEIDYESMDEWWETFKICESDENINYKHKCDNEDCNKEFIVDETCW